MAAPAIVVEHLTFRHVGRKRPALQDVSFSVAPGETLLVLGPSGSGKSTLALGLNGLIPHAVAGELTGQVRIGDLDTRDAPVAELSRQVGLVFQDPDSQFCLLRVDDELAFGLENLRTPRSEMPQRIRRALDQVSLAQHERAAINQLSGGTKQRVALASVLVMEPPVLVFDEPTSNLDPAGTEEVFAVIAELKQRGDRTLIVVEHRLDHLMPLIDRVLILGDDGQVVAFGSPDDVIRGRGAELRAIGVWVPQVAEVASHLAGRGIICEPFPITIDRAADVFGKLIQPGPPAPSDPLKPDNCLVDPDIVLAPDRPASVEPVREPAIQISRLSFTYAKGPVSLRDVSLRIERGAFVAIVGPNGAGKSTLAHHLIGSIRPPAGAIRILGHDVRLTRAPELARLVGYVFQNPEHQFVARTVFDELAFGRRVRGEPEDLVRREVDEMLDSFGLAALAPANPYTLSFGEKRRLSVATVLVHGPDVLILDEPTFGQDRKNTDALMARLSALNRAGRTIVMITHDLRLVAEYADSVVVLVEGTVAYHGSVDGLFANAALLGRAHLGLPPMRELGRQLADIDPTFPLVATVDGMVEALAARAGRARSAPRRPVPATAVGGPDYGWDDLADGLLRRAGRLR
jgi:energy-coupling factor transport system ATP-binding protein